MLSVNIHRTVSVIVYAIAVYVFAFIHIDTRISVEPTGVFFFPFLFAALYSLPSFHSHLLTYFSVRHKPVAVVKMRMWATLVVFVVVVVVVTPTYIKMYMNMFVPLAFQTLNDFVKVVKGSSYNQSCDFTDDCFEFVVFLCAIWTDNFIVLIISERNYHKMNAY